MLPGAIKLLGKSLSVSNGLLASGVTSLAPPTPIQAVATALGYMSELDGKFYCWRFRTQRAQARAELEAPSLLADFCTQAVAGRIVADVTIPILICYINNMPGKMYPRVHMPSRTMFTGELS